MSLFEDVLQSQCDSELGAGEEVRGVLLEKQGLKSSRETSEIFPQSDEKPLKGGQPNSDMYDLRRFLQNP